MTVIRNPVYPLLAAILLLAPPDARGEWICWSAYQSGKIECAAPDGTSRFDLFAGLDMPQGMALDAADGTLYWSAHNTDQVMTASLDADATPTPLAQLSANAGPRGMAIAPSHGKVYWVAQGAATIQRANLDGSDVEDLAIAPGDFFDVEVDDAAGVLYWTDGAQIWRGNLDGSAATPVVSDLLQPYYLALDVAGGKLYWTDYLAKKIGRANLDGSDRESIVTGLSDWPIGIAYNQSDGRVYWTLLSGEIQRANADGTNVETVVSGSDALWDITVVASIAGSPSVPTTSTWGLVMMGVSVLILATLMLIRRQYAEVLALP